MTNDKILKLIDSLYEKTINKQANWEKLGSDERFSLSLEMGRIVVDKIPSKSGGNVFYFGIINKKGELITSSTFTKDPTYHIETEQYKKIKDFHERIRSSYYKVDETIESLLKEINKSGDIGNSTDDLPF